MPSRTLSSINRTVGGGRFSPRNQTGLSPRSYSPYNDISSPHPRTPLTSTTTRYNTPLSSNHRHFESRPLQLKMPSAVDSTNTALPFKSISNSHQREVHPGARVRYNLNCSPKEMPSSSTWISNQKENESSAGNSLLSPSPRLSLRLPSEVSTLEVRPSDTLNSFGISMESRSRGYPSERYGVDSRSSSADSALLDRYSGTVG